MRFFRDIYLGSRSVNVNDREVEHGLVEIEYADGRIDEIDVDDVKTLTIHHRYPNKEV